MGHKVFLLFMLGLAWDVSALSVDITRGSQPIIDGWAYVLGDNLQWASGDKVPPQALPIRSGQNISLPPGGGWFWLFLPVDKIALGTDELYFFLGKFYAPAEVYFNGVKLHSRGQFPPRYFVQASQPLQVPLPASLFRSSGPNLLAVRAYYAGERMPLSESRFGGEKEHRFETEVSEVFNATLYFVFGTINFFTGVFFLIQFAFRRKDLANLLFALSSLFMALYFFEIGSGTVFFPPSLFRWVAKMGLPLSITFLVLFYIEYFKIHNRWYTKIPLLLIGLGAAVFLFFSSSETVLNDRFKTVLLPVMGFFLYSVFIVIKATLGGNRDAVPIMVGCILGVIFGSYDVAYFILGIEPFAWFQSMGFFAVEMSLFVSLAIRSARLYTELERYSTELEQKKAELLDVNSALSRFVPQEFLSFLGKDSITQIRLGDGILKEMTVVFSDIRNFTSLSERLTPDENFRLLNSYLSRMAPIIRESGGIIDKYIGDAIMALFPGSPGDAVLAALRMRASFREYNEGRLRAGYEPLETGLGLHAGPLMMGTIGEDKRMDSTVISDAVNIASRLESLTKVLGVPILISASTLQMVPSWDNLFPNRYLGRIKVRGKNEGLAVHEVISEAGDSLFAVKIAQKDRFQEGVHLFEARNYHEAKKIFLELGKTEAPDPVTQRYLQCLERGTPPQDWSLGSIVL